MKKCGQYRAKEGYAPIWHQTYGVIWIDRAHQQIIVYNPTTDTENRYSALGDLMSIVPTTANKVIGVYRDGLYILDFVAQLRQPLLKLPTQNMEDLHVAKCSPNGELWFGTYDIFYDTFRNDPKTARAQYPFQNSKLYSMTPAENPAVLLNNIKVCHDFDFHRDSNILYLVDGAKQCVEKYTYENHTLQFQEIIYTFPLEDGQPNSITIDAKGHLWIALYQPSTASKAAAVSTIVCIDPNTRQIVDEKKFPLSYITGCTIGGPHLDTLYVTSAYDLLPYDRIKYESIAGYLIALPLEIEGVANYEFYIENETLLF